MTDAALGASGLWLGTRTGAGSTATPTKCFFWPQPWLHGGGGVVTTIWRPAAARLGAKGHILIVFNFC